jgi:hypothetical protein
MDSPANLAPLLHLDVMPFPSSSPSRFLVCELSYLDKLVSIRPSDILDHLDYSRYQPTLCIAVPLRRVGI